MVLICRFGLRRPNDDNVVHDFHSCEVTDIFGVVGSVYICTTTMGGLCFIRGYGAGDDLVVGLSIQKRARRTGTLASDQPIWISRCRLTTAQIPYR